jgi:hypothetical protein
MKKSSDEAETLQTLQPTSAPAMSITEDEKQRLIALSEQNINASILKVDGPGGFHPYWANCALDGQVGSVGYFETKGFVIARDDPAKAESERFWKARGARPDGTYVIGDLILMFCPDEVWDKYEQKNLQNAKRYSANIKQHFRDSAENLDGIKIFVPEK